MRSDTRLSALFDTLEAGPGFEQRGKVRGAIGTAIRVSGVTVRIGDICELASPAGRHSLLAEVVGLSEHEAILSPMGDLRGLSGETEVMVRVGEDRVPVSGALLGRVLDARLQPLDGLPPVETPASQPLYAAAPNPMERQRIDRQVETGVRAIDGLLPLGRGQRIGVFAAAGGGKSTLLGTLARQAQADVIVIALIGERGREVREFIEDNLGSEGLARSVVIASTSDRPALERARGRGATAPPRRPYADQPCRACAPRVERRHPDPRFAMRPLCHGGGKEAVKTAPASRRYGAVGYRRRSMPGERRRPCRRSPSTTELIDERRRDHQPLRRHRREPVARAILEDVHDLLDGDPPHAPLPAVRAADLEPVRHGLTRFRLAQRPAERVRSQPLHPVAIAPSH